MVRGPVCDRVKGWIQRRSLQQLKGLHECGPGLWMLLKPNLDMSQALLGLCQLKHIIRHMVYAPLHVQPWHCLATLQGLTTMGPSSLTCKPLYDPTYGVEGVCIGAQKDKDLKPTAS